MNSQAWSRTQWTALLLALTCFTLAVHGFHPLSEDGGLYAAGVYLKLNPSLFPHYNAFVRGPMHYSQFAAIMAVFARLARGNVVWAVFIAYLATTWLMLFAARQILRRCTSSPAEQLGGVVLLATWWTLPVAGTSLVMMDPYVTARSFSTPLTLLALAYAMDKWSGAGVSQRWHKHPAVHCCLYLAIAAVAHMLMAAYALAFVVVMRACMAKRRATAFATVALAAICVASLLQMAAPNESDAWLSAEITRYYWFLSQWHWYEVAGLAGPLIILGLIGIHAPAGWMQAARNLCGCALVTGGVAFLVALLFARENAPVHLVARLQPLRVFLPIYAFMAMLLGAALVRFANWAAARPRLRPLSGIVRSAPAWVIPCIAIGMFAAQRDLYSGSPHLELPWRTARTANPWVQAFLWARTNTPADALFALNAHYITTSGEDAQTFRAIALRDALPDYSKDGGEAAIAGDLAPVWAAGSQAQLNLDKENDAERQKHLLPFGVTWMVLQSNSPTQFRCPYRNALFKICIVDANH